MKIRKLIGLAEQSIKKNSPTILTTCGITGLVTTAYLTGRASYRAARYFSDKDPYMSKRERVEHVWTFYIPAGISGALSVSCIIGAQRVGTRKTAAAQAAFAVSERVFSEYRDRVVEELGEGKEQKIRDEIAQNLVDRSPQPSQEVLVTGPGNVLCLEAFTGRYFTSDMETLRKAQNDINAQVVGHSYAYLDDLYFLIGLEPTSNSSGLGWDSDKQMELEFSTTLTKDGRPCLVISYKHIKTL